MHCMHSSPAAHRSTASPWRLLLTVAPLLLAPILLVPLAGCRGELILPVSETSQACSSPADCPSEQGCIGGTCRKAEEICSPINTTGLCPGSKKCRDGVCVAPTTTWCDCQEDEVCLSGQCVADDPNLECSPTRVDGLCPDTEICVAGNCVPCETDRACSFANPNGCCPNGTACNEGLCVPISERPCSASDLAGFCAPGYQCVSPGQCELAPCSSEHPQGACGPDQLCNNGTCEPLPCGPNHLTGACNPGEYCSSSGECIPEGSCTVAQDCQFGQYCSITGMCFQNGRCGASGDCQTHYKCEGDVCVRDYNCSNNDDCFPSEYCLTSGVCRPHGQCEVSADCGAGKVCAVSGICIDEGTCVDNEDCDISEYCNTQRLCLEEGTCGRTADCAPGHDCTNNLCEPSGTLCTTNDPPDCPEGKRCSAAGSCITDGMCVDVTDCPTGMDCVDYMCAPTSTCQTNNDCEPGQTCSLVGGCIAEGQCATDWECDGGEVCDAMFQCSIGGNCGSTEFAATLVPPNMLIVLDRSGSMAICDGDGVRRWNEAEQAINQVTLDHQDRIRFGLATYPQICPGTTDSCINSCNSNCDNWCPANSGTVNCQPGTVDIAVGDDTRVAIQNSLASNFPGGNTPTGPTLRAIADNPHAFGLPDPNDPTERDNYILLITDGEPNCDGTTSAARNRVNGALERLRALEPTISTFVVGFAFSSVNANLNCNATYGGTSRCGNAVRPNSCSGNPRSCTCTGSSSQACYYEANDAVSLSATFNDIVGAVASCTYMLDEAPPNADLLYVYLDDGSGDLTPLQRDPTHQDAWDLDNGLTRLTFYGATCEQIKSAAVFPRIFYGCPPVGG